MSAIGSVGGGNADKCSDPLAFLSSDIVEPAVLEEARSFAWRHGLAVSGVLFSRNIITPRIYVAELARHHRLASICHPRDLAGYRLCGPRLAGDRAANPGGENESRGIYNLVRDGRDYVALDVLHYDENIIALFLEGDEALRDRLLLITPEVGRCLWQQKLDALRLHRAVNGLAEKDEALSMRGRTTYAQKLVLGFLLGLLGGGLGLAPVNTLYVLGSVLNLLFFYSILLRFYAVALFSGSSGHRAGEKEDEEPPLMPVVDGDLPVYTLLVPLFREQRVVGQLIENLLALDYPREKLDIKLIFEEEDHATLAAARACAPPSCFEFVIVPKKLPQTKPKALNYALEQARGRYVVVFDAEDRPQRDQLRKAVAAFERGASARGHLPLACLQAKLNHYNRNENWLSRQFTIEYTALFDGLLPALQHLELPILLGGTSNHFRADVLREIGAWDAFNVTEDADLGIRLARFGYRCEMLPSTTYEEACCRPRDWVRQRTRWLKGWLQTYLVHMRHPATLFAQLGARGFAGFQIILGTQVLSLVVHPVFILFMIYEAWTGKLFDRPFSLSVSFFWVLALGNFVLGYVAAIWLGMVTLKRRRYRAMFFPLLAMPLYWLLISFATYRALWHYVVRPFHWEKTEHGLSGKGRYRRRSGGHEPE